MEVGDGLGYLWSPQLNKKGQQIQYYTNLTRVSVGDVIFSHANGKVAAVGRVLELAKDKERPEEFGKTGQQWDKAGWLVPVRWVKLPVPLLPKEHLDDIIPLLPSKYSPLQRNGDGQQVYLASIGKELGYALLALIEAVNSGTQSQLEEFEQEIVETIVQNEILPAEERDTEKMQLLKSRIGQGKFKQNVQSFESKCRVTGVSDERLLIASHIKPWKNSNNIERLDGANGFLLSPHIDKLFDQGWISFSLEGRLLVSEQMSKEALQAWAIDVHKEVGSFLEKQKLYLTYHQEHVFKG